MEKIYLDGWRMREAASAHAYLKRRLGFPDDYGNNLDALYDLLTERGKAQLVLRGAGRLEAYAYGKRLITVLRDAARDNPGLMLEIRRGLFK